MVSAARPRARRKSYEPCPNTLDKSSISRDLSSGHVKTLQEITDDAQRFYFREVLTATGGSYSESARIMGISRATYYRHLTRLFPVNRYSKSAFVLATAVPKPAAGPDPALLQPPLAPPKPPELPPPPDPFAITDDNLVPGPYYLVRLSRNSATVLDIDWGNREVDFTVGVMHKRQTIEDFVKQHVRAMV